MNILYYLRSVDYSCVGRKCTWVLSIDQLGGSRNCQGLLSTWGFVWVIMQCVSPISVGFCGPDRVTAPLGLYLWSCPMCPTHYYSLSLFWSLYSCLCKFQLSVSKTIKRELVLTTHFHGQGFLRLNQLLFFLVNLVSNFPTVSCFRFWPYSVSTTLSGA